MKKVSFLNAVVRATLPVLALSSTTAVAEISFGFTYDIIGRNGNSPVFRVKCVQESEGLEGIPPDWPEYIRLDQLVTWVDFPTGTVLNPPTAEWDGKDNEPDGVLVESEYHVYTTSGLYMARCDQVLTTYELETETDADWWIIYVLPY